jgi:ABC-type phosphate transport system auxiliary subunit
MDITITPDTYTPSVNNDGNYIDNIPVIKNGLFCPCGSRKDKTYENATKFATHIKTKSHQKWLIILNQNKANYYVEMLTNKELVDNQQKIIAQLENQLRKKILTIDYLTEQLTTKRNQQVCNVDLLDFN